MKKLLTNNNINSILRQTGIIVSILRRINVNYKKNTTRNVSFLEYSFYCM